MYYGNNNSKDNYTHTNRVPPGSNEEKILQCKQRTTGSDAVLKNTMGNSSERHLDRHVLGLVEKYIN